MAQYKVIAYSATSGKKIFRAHSIVDESEFSAERLAELEKGGFIKLHNPQKEEKEKKEKV